MQIKIFGKSSCKHGKEKALNKFYAGTDQMRVHKSTLPWGFRFLKMRIQNIA